jgi:hypothetical protein
VLEEVASTTDAPSGFSARTDEYGNIIIRSGG